jgi:predicted protein tyrosine phosphatase
MKKHLLFVCSGGLDRSPCAASLFDKSNKYEAKSCGLYPLTESTPLTRQLLRWADLIFVMEPRHKADILERFPILVRDKPEIILLNIPDEYTRNNPELEVILRKKLAKFL